MSVQTLREQKTETEMQLVRLLNYVLNMQEDYPDLPWPELPDTYSATVLRYVA